MKAREYQENRNHCLAGDGLLECSFVNGAVYLTVWPLAMTGFGQRIKGAIAASWGFAGGQQGLEFKGEIIFALRQNAIRVVTESLLSPIHVNGQSDLAEMT